MLDMERGSHRPPSYNARIWREAHTDHQVIMLDMERDSHRPPSYNARYGERLTQTTKL